MDALALSVLLVSVFVGSYFQAVTGFAMGMIVMAVMGATGLLGIPLVSVVVSLLAFVNVVLALRGRWQALHRRLFAWLAAGQMAAIWFGVQLVFYLDANATTALQITLGAFTAIGALSMILRPHPIAHVSGAGAALTAGLLGGVVGGMFAASGPVLGWFAYRQPLPLEVIRATLLCCFGVTTSVRILAVGVQGGLTAEVWLYAVLGLPVVLLATWLGRAFPPPLSESGIKQLAFATLFGGGVWILATAF
jgi:uncharacterized membrane protein YfcA